jgi:unspecific peroxygenase
MRILVHIGVILLFSSFGVNAFSTYASLGGLRVQEIELFINDYGPFPGASPPPPPATDTSLKLVNDANHPYQKPGPNDIRGPCPGLNTLASHGVCETNLI